MARICGGGWSAIGPDRGTNTLRCTVRPTTRAAPGQPHLCISASDRRVHTQQRLAHSVPTDQDTRRTAAVPTNEQRRETAKRKLERQLERREAQARKRRIFTIIGSALAVIAVIGAVVATFMHHQARLGRARPRRPPPPRRRRPRPQRTPRRRTADPTLPAFAAPADLGADCQYPASPGAGEQAGQSAAHRQGADRPRAGQRQHGDQPGQYRAAARQRQGALHRQQLRQPGPAGLLQRHPVPPADHHRRTVGAAVR